MFFSKIICNMEFLKSWKWVIGILHHGNAVNDFGSFWIGFGFRVLGLVCWCSCSEWQHWKRSRLLRCPVMTGLHFLAPDELEEERLGFGSFGEIEVLGLRFGVGSWTSEGFGLPQTQPALGMGMD
ncbi:hypothetical protein OIU74_004269 [Salix koriyanagi]|uniref:Uncharacterized protein n=1 Tax=Salix koriyanagi TaxID=2511006 RepID=A0A9Q0V0K3_9ROSI|nr:hypothetical protein OIU74_004269 [Salix koriyanagi]